MPAGRQRYGILVLAALMGGGALGCKLTNLLPVALAGVIVLVVLVWRNRREPFAIRAFGALRAALGFGLLALAVCAPWLIRNAITTGNPVYPLAYSIFGGADWSAANAAFYAQKAGEKGTALLILEARATEDARNGYAPPSTEEWQGAAHESLGQKVERLLLIPWNTYRWPQAYEDFWQGPLLLLVLPMLGLLALIAVAQWFFFRKNSEFQWHWHSAHYLAALFALFLLAVWAATYQSNRFLLPVPAILAAFLAAWAASSTALRKPALAALVFLLIAQGSWVAQYLLSEEPYGALRPVLGMETRDDYLSRCINYYDAAQWVKRHAPEGDGVFLAGEHRTFYFDLPVFGADWFDTPAPLQLIRVSKDANEALDRLVQSHFSLMLLNAEELLGGMDTARIAQAMHALPDAAARQQYLMKILAEGPRALSADAPLLGEGGTNYDYFRRRFSDEEWRQWLALLNSPRLKPVYWARPLVVVYEIRK